MSSQTPKPTLAEIVVNYYRTHRPEKSIPGVGLYAWRPILIEMIEDNLTVDEIYDWMTNHYESIKFRLPAKTTARDWLTQVRREINKPLRQRRKPLEPVSQGPPPETPLHTRAPEPAPAVPASSTNPGPEPEDPSERSMAEKMQIVADKAEAGTLETPTRKPTVVPVSQPRNRRPPNA